MSCQFKLIESKYLVINVEDQNVCLIPNLCQNNVSIIKG